MCKKWAMLFIILSGCASYSTCPEIKEYSEKESQTILSELDTCTPCEHLRDYVFEVSRERVKIRACNSIN